MNHHNVALLGNSTDFDAIKYRATFKEEEKGETDNIPPYYTNTFKCLSEQPVAISLNFNSRNVCRFGDGFVKNEAWKAGQRQRQPSDVHLCFSPLIKQSISISKS